MIVSDPLDETQWGELWEFGYSYAIRPEQDAETAAPPGLVLRLLVRVQP